MLIRPLTREDLRTWWPEVPLARTVRGFAAEQDNTLLGVAGLMYLPTVVYAFAEMREGGERYPVSIMRVARLMRGLMQEVQAPIVARADEDYPNAGALLERVGFERVAPGQYVFKNERG
jgi:hypothetical protein